MRFRRLCVLGVSLLAPLAVSCGDTESDQAAGAGNSGVGGVGGVGGTGGSADCGLQPPGFDCYDCDFNFSSPTCEDGKWVCPPNDCGPCGPMPQHLSCKNACTQRSEAPVCGGSAWGCPGSAVCGSASWVHVFDNAHEADLTVGSDGTITASGWFSSSVDFGKGSHTALGERDAFVVTFAANGDIAWSRAFGGDQRVEPTSIARASGGDIVVCGHLRGSVSFGATELHSLGAPDQFIVSLDGSGKPLWARRFHARSCAVEVEPDGEIVVAGHFGDSIDHDDFDLGADAVPTTGKADVYVTKLSAAGAPLWTKTFAGDAWDHVRDLTLLPNGNISVVGTFNGSIDFGAGPLDNAGLFDAFALTLDESGGHVASFSFGGAGDDAAWSAAPHPGGADLLIAASFTQTVQLGGASLTASGPDPSEPDGLIIGVGVGGTNPVATPILGVSNTVYGGDAWEVGSHPTGEWVVAGQYESALEVGGASLGNAGSYDIGVVRNAGSGWAGHRYGDAYADFVRAIAISPSKQLIMIGHIWGVPDFGTGTPEPGSDRMFIAELPLP